VLRFPCFRLMTIVLLGATLRCLPIAAEEITIPVPLRHAHAHNDYHHEQPLFEALDLGFSSVEADIFLIDGELLVGHDKEELKPERTLRNLYLDPLLERVEQRGGHVHHRDAPFFLFIDIKDDANRTRRALTKVLADYASIVGSPNKRGAPRAAVTVVLSGSSPRRGIVVDGLRLAGADGPLSQLDSKAIAAEMPVISDNWGKHFGESNAASLSGTQLERLRVITSKAHESGRLVRFWATPESEELWSVLLDNGVDLINTDELDRLANYLESRGN
jgi:hypothetical protein